jgi:hypothetical protein
MLYGPPEEDLGCGETPCAPSALTGGYSEGLLVRITSTGTTLTRGLTWTSRSARRGVLLRDGGEETAAGLALVTRRESSFASAVLAVSA